MVNKDKEPFGRRHEDSAGYGSAWDRVADYLEGETRSDGLAHQAIEYFGAEIDAEESDLTPPMIPSPDGGRVPFRGRAFSGERVPIVPVERTNGDIEQWMALGMTERVVLNPQTGQSEVAQFLIAGSEERRPGGEEGDRRRVVKLISMSKHIETIESVERFQGRVDGIASEQLDAPIEVVNKDSPEGMIARFTKKDQNALMSFAYHAANKRDAQRDGNGDESSSRSRWMGEALKEMSPGARDVAIKYATRKWGADNVAF